MRLYLLTVCICLTCCLSAQSKKEQKELALIKDKISAFSKAYMAGDIDALENAYTKEGRILPPGRSILTGSAEIRKYWNLPEGVKILHHAIYPEEIKINKNYAYDVGYYEGKTQRKDGSETSWKGKYVIVWKKEKGDWKIHLDAWNRVE